MTSRHPWCDESEIVDRRLGCAVIPAASTDQLSEVFQAVHVQEVTGYALEGETEPLPATVLKCFDPTSSCNSDTRRTYSCSLAAILLFRLHGEIHHPANIDEWQAEEV